MSNPVVRSSDTPPAVALLIIGGESGLRSGLTRPPTHNGSAMQSQSAAASEPHCS
jgi:hypothetical protein